MSDKEKIQLAIRFLKEAVKYMYPTGIKNEINEFLTKIDNDERA